MESILGTNDRYVFIYGGIPDVRRAIDSLPNLTNHPDFSIWASPSGDVLYIAERPGDPYYPGNRMEWNVYNDNGISESLHAVHYIQSGRTGLYFPGVGKPLYDEFCLRIIYQLNENRVLLPEYAKIYVGQTGKIGLAGGNGAGQSRPNEESNYDTLYDADVMRGHYKDYNPQTVKRIVKALPEAATKAKDNLERLTIQRIADEAVISYSSTQKHLKAIKDQGYLEISGIILP